MELFDFQQIGSDLLVEKRAFLLADEMGLGKTIQITHACSRLLQEGQIEKVLVVCPNSIKRQWQSEIKKWTGEDAIIFSGTKKERNCIWDTYLEQKGWWIINYEAIRQDGLRFKQGMKYALVCDEASRLKNYKTKTYKTIQKYRWTTPYFYAASGTPLENSLMNFYTLANLVKPRIITWEEMSNQFVCWQDVWTGKNYVKTIAGYKNLDQFVLRISPIFIRRTKEQVADILPKVVKNRFIESSRIQKKLYNTITEQASREDDSGVIGWTQILRMIDDDERLILQSDSPRAETIKEIVLDSECKGTNAKIAEVSNVLEEVTGKTVIFTQYVRMAEILYSLLQEKHYTPTLITGATQDKEDCLEKFKKGDSNVLICTDTLNYGVNLDEADTLINYDLHWNPAVNKQREDRIHRINSTQQKVIINLIGEGIERKVWEIIHGKQNLFDDVVEGKAISEESVRKELIQKVRQDGKKTLWSLGG